MNSVVILVLQGKISPAGEPLHLTSKRIVSVDLAEESERGDIQWLANENCWGLGDEEQGWWKIVDTFEWIEPTEELHEEKYPMAYHLTEEQFSILVSNANKDLLSVDSAGAKE